MRLKYHSFIALCSLSFSACKFDNASENVDYQPFIPKNFPSPIYDLSQNPITKEGFELGRSLFYDPILSLDSSISCGSCHQQSAAFTQHGHDISHGIHDRLGTRNAQPVMNLLWNKSFFWDGGVHQLEFVPINAITSPFEMAETLENVLAKLQRHPTYPHRFQTVFGDKQISSNRMLKSLAQFMSVCVPGNSKYDKWVRNEGTTLSSDEWAGLRLFQDKCAHCHATDLFTDHSFRNNGLEPTHDKGLYTTSLVDSNKYKFRVPTLRNLAYSVPYMHDGRFRTLEAVLKHYAEEVRDAPTLDPLLKQNASLGIPLTAEEQRQIIIFLNTLNDENFIRDKRFSEQ